MVDRTQGPVAAGPQTGGDTERASDRALAHAVVSRNRKAAAEFVDRLSDPVYRYVRYRVMPRTDVVDDLVQEVFLAAWDNLESYRGDASLETWILGIARHKVESHYRKEFRRHLSFDSEDDLVPEIAEEPRIDTEMDRERAALVTHEILSEMPETYRLLLFWRYWEKRRLAEIGEALGKTEKAVERALARARSDFKRRWDHA